MTPDRNRTANVVNQGGCKAVSFNRVTFMIYCDGRTAGVPGPPGDALMKDAKVGRLKDQAAEFRRMAERAKEAERERKLLWLATMLEDDATRLEDAPSRSDR